MILHIHPFIKENTSHYIKWKLDFFDIQCGITKYLYIRLGKDPIHLFVDFINQRWFFNSTKNQIFHFRKLQRCFINPILDLKHIEIELNNCLTHSQFS